MKSILIRLIPVFILTGLNIQASQAIDVYEESFSRSDILIDAASLPPGQCLIEQSFEPVGKPEDAMYMHTYKLGVQGQACSFTQGQAALYIEMKQRYKHFWSSEFYSLSPNFWVNVYIHDGLTVLVTDFHDGGMAGYSHQQAHVITNDFKIVPVNEQPLHDWVNSQLLQGQRVTSNFSKIHYNKTPITYKGRVLNKDDHYRHPSGGHLKAELTIIKSGDQYRLELVNSYNIGKANYYNEKGLEHYQKQRYQQAVNAFNNATQAYPDHLEAWGNLGLVLIKTGQYDQSIQASLVVYNHSEASNNQTANASYNIGLAYEKKQLYRQALKFYKIANDHKSTRARREAIQRVSGQIN